MNLLGGSNYCFTAVAAAQQIPNFQSEVGGGGGGGGEDTAFGKNEGAENSLSHPNFPTYPETVTDTSGHYSQVWGGRFQAPIS